MPEPRTKVVATVGPACDGEDALAALVGAGMDVLRLNFSHGTREGHAAAIERIGRVRERLGRPVAVLQDLQGPRIRTGRLREPNWVLLEDGARLTIEAGDFEGDAQRIATTYERLPDDVKSGDKILLSDGAIELKVLCVEGREVECGVVAGDVLGEHKGMNLPGVALSIHAPTEKDLADLAFGVEHGVDYVALSFVRSAQDVLELKGELERLGAGEVPVVAKIERPEALDALDGILAAADAVMVARGDLGIEMPAESVPAAQKRIIAAANRACVPVITATQMLESMVHSRRPTRAEATDVANAILDGTDAVMLSAETAVGDYPVRTVETMVRISREAEAYLREVPIDRRPALKGETAVREQALAAAACQVARTVGAGGVVAFTQTGATARYLSQRRPEFPIYAVTPNEATYRRLGMVWGVEPVMCPLFGSTDEMIERGEERLLELGLVEVGEILVCMAGASTNTPGGTDLLKIHRFDGHNPYA